MWQLDKAQSDERFRGGHERGIGHVIVQAAPLGHGIGNAVVMNWLQRSRSYQPRWQRPEIAPTVQRLPAQWNGMAEEGTDARSDTPSFHLP